MEQTTFFQMLSDETRLRALNLMRAEGQVCVCELVHALELSQPKISRHLLTLREAGLVATNRQAQWIFYSISESLSGWQQKVLDGALDGIKREPIIEQDKVRLRKMNNRPLRTAA